MALLMERATNSETFNAKSRSPTLSMPFWLSFRFMAPMISFSIISGMVTKNLQEKRGFLLPRK
jgi:hypothetical protein